MPVLTTQRAINARDGRPLWDSHSGRHIAWEKMKIDAVETIIFLKE